MIIIRKADYSDISKIVEIEKKCFTEDDCYPENILESLIEDTYIAVIDFNIVGMISGLISLPHGNSICQTIPEVPRILSKYIVQLAVLPEFRNKGIASALIKIFLENYRISLNNDYNSEDSRYDRTIVSLHTRISNINANNLYEKIGFENKCIVKNYYNNEDAYFKIIKIKNYSF